MNESELMDAVTGMAEIYGWAWVHFRPAMTTKGWRTPVSGSLGKGWPDLVMVRIRDSRLLFAELKTATGRETDEQVTVGLALAAIGHPVHVWRPADLDSGVIQKALRW